jgi:hypothetical protein
MGDIWNSMMAQDMGIISIILFFLQKWRMIIINQYTKILFSH